MATQAGRQDSEEGLIQACQHGDAQALNILFHRHRQSLFCAARRIMGNLEDAEDALQDGLLSAFRSLRSFEGRSQFSTWLTRIVINAALMRRRSLKARPAVAVIEPVSGDEVVLTERLVSRGENPEQLFRRLEVQEKMKIYLDDLSPILRTVFVLRIFQECSTSEAAKILSVTTNTVKARLWRARRQLAKRLSPALFQGANPPKTQFRCSAAEPTTGD